MSSQPVFLTNSATTPLIPEKLRFYTLQQHFEKDPATQYTNTRDDGYPLTKCLVKKVITPFDTVGIITAVKVVNFGYKKVQNGLYVKEGDEEHEDKAYFPEIGILVSGSDKSIRCYDAKSQALVHVWHGVHGGSAVRAVAYLGNGYILSGGMDGRLVVTDMESGQSAGQAKAHSRLVNAMDYSRDLGLVASGGYDGWVVVYKVQVGEEERKVELVKIGQHKFMQIPTVVKIAELPNTKQPVVLAGVQDSSLLNYLAIPGYGSSEDAAGNSAGSSSIPLLGSFGTLGSSLDSAPSMTVISRTNLLDSINTSTFVTFTPMALDICPDGSNRFVVATSHAPYMRLVVGKIGLEEQQGNNPALSGESARSGAPGLTGMSLINSFNSLDKGTETSNDSTTTKETENENGEKRYPYGTLILHNILAHAPQDQYSMPKIKWSRSGTGVWVSGDDGLIRGIEVETGKLAVEFGGPNSVDEDGSDEESPLGKKHSDKIRDLDVGYIPSSGQGTGQDIIVTGGVDKRVYEFFV